MLKSIRYLAEEVDDPLTGIVVGGVDPDDSNETDNVFKLGSNLTWFKLLKLFARLLQYGQEGQIWLGLKRTILGRTHTQSQGEMNDYYYYFSHIHQSFHVHILRPSS